MNLIEISKIIIGEDRQRREFAADKLHALGDSIAKNGLLHPIVLRPCDGGLKLVAGERRLRAITDLSNLGQQFSHNGELIPLGFIPFTHLGDLDELDAEEAELEENVQRENLSWQEKAAAVARLFTLRQKQAVARNEKAPTVAAIAEEVRGSSEGIHQENTRKEIILAKHLDNPIVKAAKTADEAFKALKKVEAKEKARTLGEAVGKNFTAEAHRIHNEDAIFWLQSAPDGIYDCILTDPPYGMNADEFGDSGGKAEGAHSYVDDWETAKRCYTVLAGEGYRVTKDQAHLYAFCDIDHFPELKELFTAAGWNVFRTPFFWYKKSGSRAPWPEQGPQRKYETLLYAVKGKKPILKMAGDVLEYSPDANLGHAAQKPVALYQDLLSRSLLPGQSVLDPFCGSGPIFPAAHALKVRATGIEMDQAHYGIAVKRIKNLDADLEALL